ncbi:MAG: hypothetical protein IJU42_00990 [Erysipelotrichaceae bacterium]|jgi:hypothetical protein|nr:hypothetical protein [Erysipelotrichaceae bacterium]
MKATVSLTHPASGYFDEVLVEDIQDRNCFSYTDHEGSLCEMCIYEDGLCFFRQDEDHLLELHLKSNLYAKITTAEGIVKFDVKIVDFQCNGDILVMHYLVDDEERIIQIKYC